MTRRSSWLALTLSVAAALSGVAGVPQARAASVVPGVVEVRNNFFDPQNVRVDVGGTVRWTAVDSGHTITADDGRFDFPGPGSGSGTLAAGESASWTAGAGEVVRYHCKIHAGEGMVGSIVVGDGGAPPPAPVPVLRVPADYPTVAAAVAAAPEGGVVKVAPGVYPESVEVTTARLTIEGEGGSADAVVFEGGYRRAAAITGGASASGLVVRGVSARRYLEAGFVLDGPVSRVERVAAVANEGAGVRATGPGAVVRDSRFEHNGVGILLAGDQAPGMGFDVVGNTVLGGTGPKPRAGIWVDGAWGARVTGNAVDGARLGIVVTAGPGGGVPRQVDVAGNTVRSSATADLAYDGLGLDVCFANNGPIPTTAPPTLLTTSNCNAPHAVGTPYPPVHAQLRT